MDHLFDSSQYHPDNIFLYVDFDPVPQKYQEDRNYYHHINQNGISQGDSSKIFPNLDQMTSEKCRMSAESLLTRPSTGSDQTLNKKEQSQVSFFGSDRSENADIVCGLASTDPAFETQTSHLPERFLSNSSPLQRIEEVSETILSHVDNLSPQSKQNPARNLPGLVVSRAKKDCKKYFDFKNCQKKKNKPSLPEYLYYVRDIIEGDEFIDYKEGLLEKPLKGIRIEDNTYKGVEGVFQSTTPPCKRLLLRITQSLLSANGRASFEKWLSETKKMKVDTRNELRKKKSDLLENFNRRFEERYGLEIINENNYIGGKILKVL